LAGKSGLALSLWMPAVCGFRAFSLGAKNRGSKTAKKKSPFPRVQGKGSTATSMRRAEMAWEKIWAARDVASRPAIKFYLM